MSSRVVLEGTVVAAGVVVFMGAFRCRVSGGSSGFGIPPWAGPPWPPPRSSMPGRGQLGHGNPACRPESAAAGRRPSPLPQCCLGALPVLEALQQMIDDEHGERAHGPCPRAAGMGAVLILARACTQPARQSCLAARPGHVFSALARTEEPAQRLLDGDHVG